MRTFWGANNIFRHLCLPTRAKACESDQIRTDDPRSKPQGVRVKWLPIANAFQCYGCRSFWIRVALSTGTIVRTMM